MSAFAVYVDEKLSQLNKRDRIMAKKRISNVLVDIELTADASQKFSSPFGYFVSSIQQPLPINSQAAEIPQHAVCTLSMFRQALSGMSQQAVSGLHSQAGDMPQQGGDQGSIT